MRPGGFLEFSNERLLGSGRPTWPLTERIGFHVNVTIGWTSAAGGALLWKRTPVLSAFVLGLEAGNVGMHVGMAVRERGYNPGAATAALLFLPHALLGARWLRRSPRMDARSAAVAAAGAVAFSVGLPALLRARMRRAAR